MDTQGVSEFLVAAEAEKDPKSLLIITTINGSNTNSWNPPQATLKVWTELQKQYFQQAAQMILKQVVSGPHMKKSAY